MRAGVLAFVFGLVACTGAGAPVANVNPSASSPPAGSAAASPSATPAATPSPVPVLSPRVRVALDCRLPAAWAIPNGGNGTRKAGFLSLADGKLVEDRAAPEGSMFYDRGFAKWLPVARTAVSADGRRYAYTEGNAFLGTTGKLHVVDLTTGVDRVIYDAGIVFSVVDFAAEGIYATPTAPEGRSRGLYLFDPTGGAPPRRLSASIIDPLVAGGAAWGFDYNAADPHPAPAGLEGPVNRVVRLDLRTGALAHWFYRPGADLYYVGADSRGRPIVRATFEQRSLAELWVLQSATSATKLMTGPFYRTPSTLSAIDAYGMWLGGGFFPDSAVWLYSSGAVKLVATVNIESLTVAGGCIP